jgi:hypothetical protein
MDEPLPLPALHALTAADSALSYKPSPLVQPVGLAQRLQRERIRAGVACVSHGPASRLDGACAFKLSPGAAQLFPGVESDHLGDAAQIVLT